jgi:hypothetical protein
MIFIIILSAANVRYDFNNNCQMMMNKAKAIPDVTNFTFHVLITLNTYTNLGTVQYV